MKKISQSISREYKMPHLYLDELKKIEEAVKEGRPKEYKITTCNYEYESVDKISENENRIYELKIQTYDPYINIEFGKCWARVYFAKDDLTSSGIFSKIDKILVKTERKFLWFPTSGIFISVILGAVEGQLISHAFPLILSPMKVIFLLLTVLLGVYMIVAFRTSLTSFCVIETVRRSERQSFLRRYQDQLILIAFGAIIGAIATVVLEKLLLK